MKTNKTRIPRKKKKQIPKGVYCYTPTSGLKDLGDGKYGYTIKSCPFYCHKEEGIYEGQCRMLDCEIIDQVKECHVNYPKK